MSRTFVLNYGGNIMQLIILLITLALLITLTVKCLRREDEIIELEDRIIDDFREFIHSGKNRSTHSGSVKNMRIEYKNGKVNNRAA